MGHYGRTISPAASLAKTLNFLIAFTIMAGLGFMALPSFVMTNKSISESKGGTNNRRITADLERQRSWNNSKKNNTYPGAVSINAQEKSNMKLVREIPPRDEIKDEENEVRE